MMKKQRRTFERDRKATILKKYLVDKVPISDLCDEYGIKPNLIYNWQKILFYNAEAAFEHATGRGKSKSGQEEKVHNLEAKLQQKNEVIAELLQEHVQLKKSVGEP
jgi:transposase